MRILYIANVRIPTEKAHGVQIMKTCEAFAAAGHEVELVVPDRVNDIHEDAFAYYDIAPAFKITKLSVPDLVRFGRFGFTIAALWFSEKTRLLRQFRSADITYSRDASILVQYLLLGRRFVYEAHGAPTFVSRVIARFAHRIVAISRAAGQSFVKIGVPEDKIIIAPDGVDLDAFAHPESKIAARARLGLPLDKKIALYIGRLDGWKGVDTLCESAALLPDDVLVAVIGGEPEQVRTFRDRYPKVSFVGFRPYRELADNQAAADVLVLPNTGKSEVSMYYTSPLKLFTYMASGVPIVASDTPAMREVLSDEDAYFFVPDNPQVLAASLELALTMPADAEQKACRAREDVTRYTWGTRAQTILSALEPLDN